MIPANKLAQAGRDFLCDTLSSAPPGTDLYAPENHVSRLVPEHIRECQLCRDKIDQAHVFEDVELVGRLVHISIANALVSKNQEDVEVKIDSSITIPVEKVSKINAIARHVIQKFAASYQN